MPRISQYPDKRAALVGAVNTLTRHGRAPTVRDLAEHIDASVGTTHRYLSEAKAQGLIDWPPRGKRKLFLTSTGHDFLHTHAGTPTTAGTTTPAGQP